MVELLKEEMETYEARKRDLVTNSIGKFVLIKDNQVVDVFEAQGDAIRQGYERFGNVPFLVKQIVEVETPQNPFPRIGYAGNASIIAPRQLVGGQL